MATNPLKVLSDLFVKEQAVLKKGLVVSGSISGSVGLHVKRDAIIEGDLDVGGTVSNAGYAQVGALQVDGILDIAGNSYLSGNVDVTGQLNVNGPIYADSAIIDELNVGDQFAVGAPNILIVKQEGAISQNNPNTSYTYAKEKLFITPSGSYVSGSSFMSDSIIDLNSIDSSLAIGSEAQDVGKSLKTLDDYLHRLNQVIEF
jgi:cytoskeletal protein CcmA (bactofilin family)